MPKEANISMFLHSNFTTIERERNPERIVLGIDQNLNCAQISALGSSLVAHGLVLMSIPLWDELRERADWSLISFRGGIPSKSIQDDPSFRKMRDDPTFGKLFDIGIPIKGSSFSDQKVVELAVSHFVSYDRIIILTEDSKLDAEGLRNILNEQVRPWLSRPENDRFSLVVLYKRGKTSIEDYCAKVEHLIRQDNIRYGYTEKFL